MQGNLSQIVAEIAITNDTRQYICACLYVLMMLLFMSVELWRFVFILIINNDTCTLII